MRRAVDPVRHFLLVFDRDAGRLIETIDFGTDSRRAVEAYTAKERQFEGQPRIEVVLIGSDSLETIKVTHANYFDDSIRRGKYFSVA